MSRFYKTMPDKHVDIGVLNTGLESWELSIFLTASYFTVIKIVSRVSKTRSEYENFNAAIADAEAWKGPNQQMALIYAVTAAGRSTCLDRDKWHSLAKLWSERRKRC